MEYWHNDKDLEMAMIGSALGEIEYIGTDTVKVSDNKCSYTGKHSHGNFLVFLVIFSLLFCVLQTN